MAADGKISGKFVLKKNSKSYSFKADRFEGFEDGALRAATSLKYGKKACTLEIAVGQDPETGKTIVEIAVAYGGKPYGGAAFGE